MQHLDETRVSLGETDALQSNETRILPTAEALSAETEAFGNPEDEDLEQSLAYQSLMKHRAERKKKRIVKGVVAGVLALVAVVAIVLATRQPADDTGADIATASVTREDFVDSVSVNGAARPVSSVIVNPEVDGTIDQVLVKEGDTVEAGQTLFTLKNDDLDRAVRDANQQVKEAQNGVSSAQTTLDSANNAANRANADVAAAQADADTKAAAYNALENDPAADPDAVAAAQSELDAANAALNEVKSTAASAPDTVAEAKNSLSSAQLALTSAQEAYNEAVKATEKRTVTAPSAGAVVVMNAVPGALVSAGASDTSGKSTGSSNDLIQIADLSQMRVTVQVNEADISKVQVGQKATVTFSALPDVTCEGEVQSIATVSTGDGTGDGSGTVTYAVDLLIAQPDPRIKPGMTASVEIVAQEVKDALTVPATAIATDDAGAATVTVVTYADDGSYTTEDVPVEVVAQNNTTAAIKGDVHEDDLVLLGGATSDDDSDASAAEGDIPADETVTYG